MKILLKCTTSDENLNWCRFALVTLSDEAKKEVLARRELFQMVKARDADLWCLNFWGISGDFYDTLNIETLLTDDQLMKLETEDYIVLPDGMVGPASVYQAFFEGLDPARTECDRMIVDDGGFYWKCIVKHTNVYVETVRLPFEAVL
jgi:hypothetical protein